MKFIITEHAEIRLIKRLKCKPHKMLKIVEKAWWSKSRLSWREEIKANKKSYDGLNKRCHYRQIMGYTFVFADRHDGVKALVTIF